MAEADTDRLAAHLEADRAAVARAHLVVIAASLVRELRLPLALGGRVAGFAAPPVLLDDLAGLLKRQASDRARIGG